MNLIRFSVNRPVTTCMLMLALVMGGAWSFSRMEVELLPGISIPTLVVAVEVPQVSPEQVHEEVTLPLEEALNGVSRLDSMNSLSYEGGSRLLLEFAWGSDVRTAEIEVREQINAIRLPESASRPLIRRFDPSSAPVFRFDILGEALSAEELRRVAESRIKPRLERLAGVGEIEIIGGTDAEFRVVGDRERLARYNLTVLGLVQGIARESRNRKGGRIVVDGGKTASVRIEGKANSVADLANLIVATSPEGRSIRVGDVAEVIRTTRRTESYARIDGAPSVGLAVKKAADASVVTVVEEIREELDRLDGSLAERGIAIRVSQDDSEYVLSSQSLVVSSIVEGVGLAGILLFLFLRDLRASIIVILATPVSLISSAIFLDAFDISRNILTLGGMGLSVGLTLDSSIVLIESIYKQLSQGQSPREAAIRGASEVAGGIFSSTMTSVAVFLPILFIPGLMQEIFRSLAHAIIWSVLMSMVVGILFIPMISARILTPRSAAARGEGGGRSGLPALFGQFGRGLDRWDRRNEAALSRVLRVFLRSLGIKLVIIVSLVGISVLSLFFLPGRGFLPRGQVDELWIRFEAPPGATLDYVDVRMRQVEALLLTEPYKAFVRSVSADVRPGEGRLFVRLYPGRKAAGIGRTRPGEWRSLSRCMQQIREGCDTIPDLPGNTFVSLVDKIRGGTRAPIIFQLYPREAGSESSEAEQLSRLQEEVRERLLPELEEIPGALYQRVNRRETPREIVISTRDGRQSLLERGLSTRLVSDTVRASVYGVEAATVWEEGGEVDVTVMLDDGAGGGGETFSREAIESLQVRSPSTGRLHRLRDIAQVGDMPEEGGVVLERTNRTPAVNLESHHAPYDVSGKSIGDVAGQIERALLAAPGFADRFAYQVKGEARDTRDSFRDAFVAFLISVGLIYMIMSSQFEKFLDPLAIMITVPLAAAGAVLMLRATGEIFSLGAFVGAVILCGIVVNSGILLVEYVNILRKRGVPRNEAIIGGAVRKLRSILITSLTSVIGMFPLVFGVGEGTELYRGVAAVVVGGLLVSTPLTLIALPLLYSLLDDFSEFWGTLQFRFAMMRERIQGGGR